MVTNCQDYPPAGKGSPGSKQMLISGVLTSASYSSYPTTYNKSTLAKIANASIIARMY